jgi:hypothetical protein
VCQTYPLAMNLALEIQTDQKRDSEIMLLILLSLLCYLERTNEPRRELASHLETL